MCRQQGRRKELSSLSGFTPCKCVMGTWRKSPNFLRPLFLHMIITILYLIFYYCVAVLLIPNYSLLENYKLADIHSHQSMNFSQKGFSQDICFLSESILKQKQFFRRKKKKSSITVEHLETSVIMF